jgi:tetratricopeptide (TPR) repeat protein
MPVPGLPRIARAALAAAGLCLHAAPGPAAAVDIDALWDYAEPAASEQRLRAALDGASPVQRLELQTQIARTYSLRRRFDDAHRVLDGVQADPQSAVPVVAVRLDLERGRTHNSAGDRGRARPLFERVYAAARKAGLDGLAVDAAHMVAITHAGSAEALRWNDLGLALARISADPTARRLKLALLNNSAWDLHEMKRWDEALMRFREALDEAQATGSPTQVRIARWSVARCLRSLGRHDEALAMQRSLLAELDRTGATDGYVDEEVAENLLALGRGDEARAAFARAAELLGQDPQFARDEPARLARLKALGAAR